MPRPGSTSQRRSPAKRGLRAQAITLASVQDLERQLASAKANVDAAKLLMQCTPPSANDLHTLLADIERDVMRAAEKVRQMLRLAAPESVDYLPA